MKFLPINIFRIFMKCTEQIGKAVDENNVGVIFAVGEKVMSLYQELEKHIPGSRTAELRADSSNIIEIITEEYNVRVQIYISFGRYIYTVRY